MHDPDRRNNRRVSASPLPPLKLVVPYPTPPLVDPRRSPPDFGTSSVPAQRGCFCLVLLPPFFFILEQLRRLRLCPPAGFLRYEVRFPRIFLTFFVFLHHRA